MLPVCQFRRSNAPLVRASIKRGSDPPPSSHVIATVLNFFSMRTPFLQMFVICNKQLATVWIKKKKLMQRIIYVNNDDQQKKEKL